MSDISNEEKTAQLKKGLNADWVVYGVVTRLGRTFVITATLIDLNTNETMGGAPMQMDSIEEAFDKMDGPITEMIQRLTGGSGAGTVQRNQRPGGGAGALGTQVLGTNVPSIGIEVSTNIGGTLYLRYEEQPLEEVAVLWDNDTYTIPIERPGNYIVWLDWGDGNTASIRTVSITSRGITRLDFDRWDIYLDGPGGGTVFFAEGGKHMEVSEYLGEYDWYDALSVARDYRGGGYSDWRLPTKDELNLIYQNLKNIGNWGDNDYWSSSEEEDNSSNAWEQWFNEGSQTTSPKGYSWAVRAVRDF
jgi:hypothetical protein